MLGGSSVAGRLACARDKKRTLFTTRLLVLFEALERLYLGGGKNSTGVRRRLSCGYSVGVGCSRVIWLRRGGADRRAARREFGVDSASSLEPMQLLFLLFLRLLVGHKCFFSHCWFMFLRYFLIEGHMEQGNVSFRSRPTLCSEPDRNASSRFVWSQLRHQINIRKKEE